VVLAVTLYLAVVRFDRDLEAKERKFIIFVQAFPLLLTVLPLTTNNIGYNEYK
jgi:hypothetical protein